MLLTVTLLLFLMLRTGGGVICYICHWANTSSSPNTCRNGIFDPSTTNTDSCDNGCQTLTLYEGNKTTMFTRQCADKTIHKNECKTVEMIPYLQRKYCYCSTNYCNAASHSVHRPSSRAWLSLWLLLSYWANGRHALSGWTP